MKKYTDEQEKYYTTMAEKISVHPDFGKRNPVDIGRDYGYSEAEVLEMIQMIRDLQENEQEKDTRETYYFGLMTRFGETAFGGKTLHIVSVNINTWETKIVKSFEDFVFMPTRRAGAYKWKIRNHILGWIISESEGKGNLSGFLRGSTKIFCWENLETGEQKKFLSDVDIKDFLIREDNIYLFTEDEVVVLGLDGEVIKREAITYIGNPNLIFEADNQIYIVGSNSIYKLNNEFNVKKIADPDGLWSIKAVEFWKGKLTWYEVKEDTHLFSDNTWSYHRRREGEASYGSESTGVYGSISGISKGIFTQNYRLLQQEIRTMDNKHKICTFNRQLSEWREQDQTIGIAERDIFIGVTEDNKIIKVDLKNERQPVVLPVELK